MKVLFSPLGMTDPVSEQTAYDGSLLQICRFHKPDKVYLYMSGEIMAYHEKDNRYIACLDRVYDHLKKPYEHVIIDRRALTEVHIFDFFYKEYRDILLEIHRDYPEAEILLNVSSGTPAMKQALFVLCGLFNFPMTPLQVSTPIKRSNATTERMKFEDPVADYLEIVDLIMSEPKVYGDRTEVAIGENLNFELRKDIIKNHLMNYNYGAAMDVADAIREALPEEVYHLIAAAFYRNSLNQREVNKHLSAAQMEFEYYQTANRKLVEYILYLSVLIKRKMLLEFIRGISPALDQLFKLAFETAVKVDLDRYIRDSKGKLNWDDRKLRSDEMGRSISEVLEKAYWPPRTNGPASTDSYLHLIQSDRFAVSDGIRRMAEELRTIEKNGRNVAAHQIISIDDDYLLETTGYRAQKIIDKIIAFARMVHIGVKDDHWTSYEVMNRQIIRVLTEGIAEIEPN